MKKIEEILKETSEENMDKTDWSTAWSKKYPILKRYKEELDTSKYEKQIGQMIDDLKNENAYSDRDAMLVIKDILYKEYLKRK